MKPFIKLVLFTLQGFLKMKFSNGGKLGGVADVELDGIRQTGRVVRWLSLILCVVTTPVKREKKVQAIIRTGKE